jgi:uncharacterized repeat protein (TIGR03803 family)
MPDKQPNSLSRIRFSAAMAVVTIVIMLALTVLLTRPLQAQTYQLIYSFTGGTDGQGPSAGLAMDRTGNFYGTTEWGGSNGYGTVFKLSSTSSGWILSTLYSFTGGEDGGYPQASLTLGPNGIVYGTTWLGGGTCTYPYGSTPCGLVFELRPPPNAMSTAWTETAIHTFTGAPNDGAGAGTGTLALDSAGNLYGTTGYGGEYNSGTFYELTPTRTAWTLNILYNGGTGEGVVADSIGNYYGVNGDGGAGAVYKLSLVGRQWTMTDLYDFQGGDNPWAPTSVILGADGNLYGTTFFSHSDCGGSKGGSVFMLLETQGYRYLTVLYDFASQAHGPDYGLIRDASGNLYGGDDGGDLVYRLTPAPPGEYWGYTDLHDFGGSGGDFPLGNLIFDPQGNIWGTTEDGGAYGYGVVWEITLPSEQSAPVTTPAPGRVIRPAIESCP